MPYNLRLQNCEWLTRLSGCFIIPCILLLISLQADAQDVWTKKADFGPGVGYADGTAFSIGGKGYFVLGGGYNDLWEYNPATNAWTQKTDYPGGIYQWGGQTNDKGRRGAVSFVIAGKAYVGMGDYSDDTGRYFSNAFWQYDPLTNAWKQKASYPGLGKAYGVGFAINNKGYVGTGFDDPSRWNTKKDFYEYDPGLDKWTRKADFGGSARAFATAFVVNGKGYIGGGEASDNVYDSTPDFWAYDPATNKWTQKANSPYWSVGAIGFEINKKGYMGGGFAQGMGGTFYEYDDTTDKWSSIANLSGPDIFGGSVQYVSAFSLNGKAYVGNGNMAASFYEYTPAVITPPVVQAPNISYTNNIQTYTTGTAISALKPTNSGGAVPAAGYAVADVFAGSGTGGYADGNGTGAMMQYPTGITFDAAGNMFVADYLNSVIRKITPGGLVSTFAGNAAVQGATNGTGLMASFRYPQGIASDASGNLYVADLQNNLIRKITSLGVVTTLAGSGLKGNANGTGISASFTQPSAIAIDNAGNLYVADSGNEQIRKITPAGVVTNFAGSGATGAADGAAATASFYSPSGITIDGDGNLYVSDTGNNLIRKITSQGVVTTFAGKGNIKLNKPHGITSDAAGNIYVANALGNIVNKITSAGVISTLSKADGTPLTFNGPTGLAISSAGYLYVAGFSNQVQKVTEIGYSISPALPAGLIFDANVGTISGTPTAASASTNYKITAYNTGGSSSTTINITIKSAIIKAVLSFPALANAVYGDADITIGVTSTNTVTPITYTSSNNAVATIVNNKIHIIGAGNTSITASQTAGSNFTAAVAVAKTLTVTPMPLAIIANNRNKTYGAANPALTLSYSGFVNGDDDTKLSVKPVAATTANGTSAVGTYAITASGAASNNYTFIYNAGVLTVTPAQLTITANNQSKIYGAANPALTLSYNGFINGDDVTKLSVKPLVTTTATATSIAGTYPITVNGASGTNYSIAYVQGVLTVSPAPAPVISTISASTITDGTTVVISGSNFLGATSVSFGGKAASSFTVSSSTSITAIVAAGSANGLSVTTTSGTANYSGLTFVPVPVITAGGPTIIKTGSSVVLTASAGTGTFVFQWLKDGINISGATSASYAATQSGVYTVRITLNQVSQLSAGLTVTTVFSLPTNNFKLEINSATCKGSNNGSVNITAIQGLNYTAIISGNGLNSPYNFTNTQTISNLSPGTYTVCITVSGQPGYQQCFSVILTEPKDLSVYSTVNPANNMVNLVLDGASQYNITLNGTSYTTKEHSIDLPLNAGINNLAVTTDKLCQGTVEKNIVNPGRVLPYPNPFQNVVSLNLGKVSINNVSIEIHSVANGELVFDKRYVNQAGTLEINVSDLKSGIYALKLSLNGTANTFKIIKK